MGNNLFHFATPRYSTPGGYSAKAVHPIALAKVMNIAQMMKSEFGDKEYSLSGIGGVETGGDAAEFILLGANTVQVLDRAGAMFFPPTLFTLPAWDAMFLNPS